MKILIDTDWSMFLEDLPAEKQLEFFWAVFDYGNRECSLKCWNKIKPILEKGKIGYFNRLKTLKNVGVKPIDTSVDTINDTNIVSGSVSVRKETNSRNNSSSLSTTHVSKFTPPTENEILEYAKQQNDMAGMGGLACTEEQAQDFYDYYSGIGWKLPNDAQTPILDWKPFFRKWVRNPKYKNEPQKDPNDEAYEADCRFLARRKREREEVARNGGIK